MSILKHRLRSERDRRDSSRVAASASEQRDALEAVSLRHPSGANDGCRLGFEPSRGVRRTPRDVLEAVSLRAIRAERRMVTVGIRAKSWRARTPRAAREAVSLRHPSEAKDGCRVGFEPSRGERERAARCTRRPLPPSPERERGWRRERDSNPRNRFRFSGFQDHRHRPLGHPSASKSGLNSLVSDVRRSSPALCHQCVTVSDSRSLQTIARATVAQRPYFSWIEHRPRITLVRKTSAFGMPDLPSSAPTNTDSVATRKANPGIPTNSQPHREVPVRMA